MSSASSAVTYTSVYTDSEHVAPPSPDYIPGPEEPQTPPAPQDEDEHEPMFIQTHDPNFVPEPIYPEYVAESDPEEDPEEYEDDETEDGLVNYPMDGRDDGDDDDGDSSGDNADDEDEDEENEEEEEEHLAPTNSAVIIPTDELAAISFPPEAEVERLLAMPTPSPSQLTSLSPPFTWELLAGSTALAALPLPPLPPPPHMPPPSDRRDDILEIEMLPHKRLCLSTLGFRYEVGESSTARSTGGQGIDYRDTWIDPAKTIPEIAHMTVGERVDLLMEDMIAYQETIQIVEDEAYAARKAWAYSIGLRTEGVVSLTRWIEKMELVFQISGCAVENQVKFATCTLLDAALTWWNSQIRSLGPDADSMTWEVLKKKMTGKYCPQGEIKKLEIELWNLKVKENNVSAYTERFQELTQICTKFFADETKKIDKYVSGLLDNIYKSVKASKPETLDETIELANDLTD
uniref:Reverse transcriptase domain-containing protein n=1 Tax=Tanacetum cinerariifolium TaxID=118510 RepID=A0A6L2JNR6_TANCI|nr:reverse transcriptase domain-containing protein [Tanacetum cinerariifolium]